MLANVAASAASQRFGAPEDAPARCGRSYAHGRSPGWRSAFRGLLRGMPCRTSSWSHRWEIVISLSCEQNSAPKFQSGVSNSGFQIPKHARQNSEVTENSCFTLQKPVERPQNSSRRFLDSRFCFRVPFRGWNLGRFPFPISRFSVQIQGR